MDPHIYPGQPSLPSESSTGEEGVNYLRRLKGEAAEGAPADAGGSSGGKTPTDATSFAWKGLRQSPRLRCSGSVKFRTEGSDLSMWGTLTDISLHGCYVETNTTFPIDTKVDLVLKSFGIRIQTGGTVRTSYPSLGIGICFGELDPEQEVQLKQLLDALTGRSAVSNVESARENGMKNYMGTVDLKAFLDEMTEFFRKNQLLSRDEFHKIAKRVRRF
ncbi:MAG: PilZ domain-containing protein [Terriglobales bacterium]